MYMIESQCSMEYLHDQIKNKGNCDREAVADFSYPYHVRPAIKRLSGSAAPPTRIDITEQRSRQT